ncbi:MAG TPA: hypothetical protein VGL59_01880 [Polyangia bacterium]
MVAIGFLASCSSSPAGTIGGVGGGGGAGAQTGGGGAGGAETSAGSGGTTSAGSGGDSGNGGNGGSITGGTGGGGAGGGDAAMPSGDAAIGDAGNGVGGPSRCASAGLALCEDFENGLDATLWKTTKNGDGTAVVDDMHAARGTKALHVRTVSGSGVAYVTERMSFPATNNILYARMFLYLGDPITTDGHFSLAQGAGTGTGAVIRFGGQFKEFGVGTDQGSSGDWTDHDNKTVPAQTWMCVEFEFKGDSNEFHVWQDDVERTALHSGANKHGGFTMPAFNSLWFGWWMYNATEPQDLWIDEIAVDFKPIGCAK